MQPRVRRNPTTCEILNIIITNVPDWVQRLENLGNEIKENQAMLEADERQAEQAPKTGLLEVPPEHQEVGSGSHNSITPSVLRRQTRQVTTTSYYHGFAMEFFEDLVKFVSGTHGRIRKVIMAERIERLVAEAHETNNRTIQPYSEKAPTPEIPLRRLRAMLESVGKEAEGACHDILRGTYEERIARVVAGLNEVRVYAAERIQAEGLGDTAPGSGGTIAFPVNTGLKADSE